MEYKFHPAADLFPMMSDRELVALGDDMLQHGQREPIILYHGQILDGRNRYRACIVKGIEPKVRSELPPDPHAFVATVNLHRRHLSEEQRGMIAARLATMKKGQNQHSPNGETSQAKAAELLKVSKRRVERSHEVIAKGVPDLVDAVERRDVKVSAAAEFAKVTPPLDQARLIAEHGSPAAAVRATVNVKADRAAKPPKKPKPDVSGPADRAERAADAKLRETATSSYAELIEARKEIERLLKRVDEFENFLPAYNQWLLEADQIVKSRKRVMSHGQWSDLVRCLHPDTRKNLSDEEVTESFRLVNRLKLVLCDEKEVPTQKPRTPGHDWEARRRKVSETRKADRKVEPAS
jgi:hypothetical protein